MAKKKTDTNDSTPNNGDGDYQVGDMITIRYRITGITPLMQHNAASMKLPEPAGKKGGLNIVKPEHLTGAAEAEAGTYRNTDGAFFHPAEAFRAAVIEAVAGTKIGKKSAKEVFRSGFFVTHSEALLIQPETSDPLDTYKVDTRNVVNPTTGGMIPRSRPVWDVWACEIEAEYDPFSLRVEIITESLNLAGRKVGIGQLRPKPPKRGRSKEGNGGRFGKFKAHVVE